MDAVTTFLNEDLIQNIYMDQPEGYVAEGDEFFMNLLAIKR
jgi:hypothetical protein